MTRLILIIVVAIGVLPIVGAFAQSAKDVRGATPLVAIPVGVSVLPDELYRAPKSWTQRAYHNLVYFNEASRGGHFAAWEEPVLFSAEVRAAFRPLHQVKS